jgi:hypothetical protein
VRVFLIEFNTDTRVLNHLSKLPGLFGFSRGAYTAIGGTFSLSNLLIHIISSLNLHNAGDVI